MSNFDSINSLENEQTDISFLVTQIEKLQGSKQSCFKQTNNKCSKCKTNAYTYKVSLQTSMKGDEGNKFVYLCFACYRG